MKRTPKAPRIYPPIDDCPPCRFGCDQIWDCKDPSVCVHTKPLISDRVIAWAMLAICIALGIFALIGWL
ncbi:MAG: hypothetical protein EB116_14745 [Betaproteobacteria bacterium]|nr:hypothetical protein [Betaproteobacteria bacterium]